MFDIHGIRMLDGAGPNIPDRLTMAAVYGTAFPAAAASVGTVGAVTAGSAYTAIPSVTPTGGTLVAGGWPAVIRLTLKVVGTPGLVNAGAGHVVNDVLTFANGVTITVNTVTSGAIATFTLTNAGSFAGGGTLPGSGGVPLGTQSQISTTGAGTGAGFTFSWGLNTAIVDDGGNYSVVPTGYTIVSADGNGASGALAVGAAVAAGGPLFRAVGPFINDGLPPNYLAFPVVIGSVNTAEVNEKCSSYVSIRIYPIQESTGAVPSVTAGSFDCLIIS